MVFRTGRAVVIETSLSFVLLGVMVVIAVGVLVKQSCYNPSIFGVSGQKRVVFQGVDFFSSLPDGFDFMGAVEFYDADNLYEKIDGKAEMYLPAGFVFLTSRRIVSASDSASWFEVYVYDMNSAGGAFSVYSAQKRPESVELSYGDFACRTDDAVFFVSGQYYVEMIASQANDELLEAMSQLARLIVRQTAAKGNTEIPELVLFGRASLNSESVKLISENAFGSGELKNIFLSRSRINGQQVKFFLARKDSDELAAKQALDYYRFLIENGAVAKQAESEIENFKVVDFYGDTEIVFSVGLYFAGVHQGDDFALSVKAAEILAEQLKKEAPALEK